jgi:hypothetical protein
MKEPCLMMVRKEGQGVRTLLWTELAKAIDREDAPLAIKLISLQMGARGDFEQLERERMEISHRGFLPLTVALAAAKGNLACGLVTTLPVPLPFEQQVMAAEAAPVHAGTA